jgi:hypothetical protein
MFNKRFVYMNLVIVLFVFQAAIGQKKVFFEHLSVPNGLPELKNPAGEQFDYLRVKEIFRDIADQPPQAIIDRMVYAGEMWRKDQQPDDDITLMVIKAR